MQASNMIQARLAYVPLCPCIGRLESGGRMRDVRANVNLFLESWLSEPIPFHL